MIVTRARTPGVPRRPASWWAVVGVIGVLVCLSAALALLLPDTDHTTGGWHSAATFVLLTVMFGLAEVYVLHVQVKREAQTVALSEIPLVLGLTFVDPTYASHRAASRACGIEGRASVSVKSIVGGIAPLRATHSGQSQPRTPR